MAHVAYIRVSSTDQNTERQLDGIDFDIEFTDKCSGGSTERPQLAALLKYVRDGDTVIVHSIDRLARNLQDLLQLINQLNSDGVGVKFHKEGLQFTGEANPMNELMLNVMGAVAQFERSMIRERQREGIAKAKANGVYKGRTKKITPDAVHDALVANDGNKAAAARQLGCSVKTIYRNLSHP